MSIETIHVNLVTLPADVVGLILKTDTICLQDYIRYRCISKQIANAMSLKITSLQPNPSLPDGIYDSISVDVVMSLPNLSLLNSRYEIVIRSEDQLIRLGSHPSLHRAIINIKLAEISYHRAATVFIQSYLQIKGRKRLHPKNGYTFVFDLGSSKQAFFRLSETELYLSGYPFAISKQVDAFVSILQSQSGFRTYIGEIDFNLEMIPRLPQLKIIRLKIPNRIIFLGDQLAMSNVKEDAEYSFRHLFSTKIVAYRSRNIGLHQDARSSSYYLIWIRCLLDCLDGLIFPHVKIFFPIPVMYTTAERIRKIFPHLRKIHLTINHESDLPLIREFLSYPSIVLCIDEGSRFKDLIPKYLQDQDVPKDRISI